METMSSTSVPLDVAAAEAHLMRFLSVEGVTGHEANIAAAVSEALKEVGVPASAIRFDDANTRIPLPTETGNLIVELPGTRPGPRLFSRPISTRCRFAPAPSRVARATDRLGRHDSARRRRPHRRRAAGRGRRDAHQAQAPASADHLPVHRARGKRPARRPRAESRPISAAPPCASMSTASSPPS